MLCLFSSAVGVDVTWCCVQLAAGSSLTEGHRGVMMGMDEQLMELACAH